jgi:hypothetical protein
MRNITLKAIPWAFGLALYSSLFIIEQLMTVTSPATAMAVTCAIVGAMLYGIVTLHHNLTTKRGN